MAKRKTADGEADIPISVGDKAGQATLRRIPEHEDEPRAERDKPETVRPEPVAAIPKPPPASRDVTLRVHVEMAYFDLGPFDSPDEARLRAQEILHEGCAQEIGAKEIFYGPTAIQRVVLIRK